MKILLLILLLIIPAINAQEIISDYNQYSYLIMNFNINGEFQITQTGSRSQISEIITNLTFIPKTENNQIVIETKTESTPQAEIIIANSAMYKWTNPEEKNYLFSLKSKVKVENKIISINEKMPFPLTEPYTEFTSPTEYIDITPEIRAKALEIAEGEDDQYVVAFKIGEWVRSNIKYDLSTLTADVVQKSSWVLENKEGVCDELTNLYISMMRSVGIPARFVSGMAYTNLLNDWGAHAWAEVYFPDKGWVPFDVTYGQLGWLDPSHIKIQTTEDSGESSVLYTWKSYQTDFQAKELKLKTTIQEQGQIIKSPIELKVNILENKVGPGSYVPIEIEATNNAEYYMPIGLTITKAPGLTQSNFRPELLKPRETKKFFWTAKIDNTVQSGYIFKTYIEIQDQYHSKATGEIEYSKDYKIIKEYEAQKIIEENEIKDDKILSPQLSLSCISPDHIFIYEDLEVECTTRNTGNSGLNNIDICTKNDCKRITSLTISEQKKVEFKIQGLDKGVQSLIINAKSENIQTSDTLVFEVLKTPDLNIINIDYPKEINYKDDFEIVIVIAAKAPVKDIAIIVKDQEVIKILQMDNSNKAIIKTRGKEYWKEQQIPIIIKFKDANGREYELNKIYDIKIINIPWYAKLFNWIGL